MKSSLLIGLVAGGASGAVSAALTTVLLDTAPETSVSAIDPAGGDLAAVRAANESLAQRLGRLEDRFAVERPAGTRPERAPASAAEADELDVDQLKDLLASFEAMEAAPPAKFQSMVDRAIESREERERLEREERRRQERDERLAERVAEMAGKLGLDAGQQSALTDVLTAREAEREEVFRALREGGTWGDREALRETFVTLAATTNAQIQGVLTEQQYAQYQELYGGDRGGFGGFRGGGDFRGGDRGGEDD